MPPRLGTSSSETLTGTNQRDLILGKAGDDVLIGLDGADKLNGGKGADSIEAGKGKDLIVASRGADIMSGGDGYDTLTYASATFGVQLLGAGLIFYDFSAGPAFSQNWAPGQKFSEIEAIKLTNFNDRIAVLDQETTLFGRKGDDYLVGGDKGYGGRGDDILDGHHVFGGRGNDDLTGTRASGGKGNDRIAGEVCYGGTGADTFEFQDATTDHVVKDVAALENDMIRFIETSASTNFTFTDFASMLDDTTEDNGHALISWTGGSLKLKGIAKVDLLQEWFDFDLV